MSVPSITSTYGAWLISLFFETILYGMGILQVFLYFQWWPTDTWSIKAPVIIVMFFETTQISFFFRSTFFRFVQRFGIPQGDLIWSNSLQLLANYLTAFAVQMYFASRIYRLTKESVKMHQTSIVGIYVIVLFAVIQILAGITQTIWTYQLRSYSKLDKTKAITTLQTAASLSCDIGITVYLCVFLARNKTGTKRTEKMLNALMMNAVNRGMLTALCSAFTMCLFLAYPDTFWFFIPLAPSSKLYMNSMLVTLNMRQRMRDKVFNGWNTIDMNDIDSNGRHTLAGPVSAVEFVKPSRENDSLPGTTSDFPSSDSVV